MSGRLMVTALLAIMLGAGMAGVVFGVPPASGAPGDAASSDSAMTLSGKGDFANLRVTVSQTKNLINQVVTVSWEGGAPTDSSSGPFLTNYLQIMQCWGDDPNGPDRTQCQFGAVSGNISAGLLVRERALQNSSLTADPNEALKPPADKDPSTEIWIPFWPAGRDEPKGPNLVPGNDFFDAQVTNEIPLARTHADGTGEEFFEIQTIRQSAGLGCGDPVTTNGVTTGRKCWLVVVPRGTKEANGSVVQQLNTSPLSQSNWDNRIVFPLAFLPVGRTCPLGTPERRVIGHELMTDAVGSWQPALCADGGSQYSYTQLTDDITRNQLLVGGSPSLALMTNPVPPEQAPDPPLAYAPVGLSGLAIAFFIEHQAPPADAPPEQQQLTGVRFTSMKLTPRLVAKLLTQSYQLAVKVRPPYLKSNPLALTTDPEFLELNPEYAGFLSVNRPTDMLVQLGTSDLTSLLWSWVISDPDAKAFLDGEADEHDGMVVNENNKGLTLPTSTFPRNDQSCSDTIVSGVSAKSCTLDAHPFTNDMHDSGRSASRGDTQARDFSATLENGKPALKKADRQNPGQRAVLAVVDTATAVRYSLTTASLRNAAGQFVAPTTASLLAGEKAMKPSPVPGVLVSDPAATDPAAYPLTALSYAVTAPSTLDEPAKKDYAAFLRYAAGPGQQPGVAPGQLPLGMVPLPEELRAQTLAVAKTIDSQTASTPDSPPASVSTNTASASQPPAASQGGGPAGTVSSPGGGANPPLPPAPVTQPAASPTASAPSLPRSIAGILRRTPRLPAPAVGALLATILICGVLAVTSASGFQPPIRRRLGAAVRRLRKGVMPPER